MNKVRLRNTFLLSVFFISNFASAEAVRGVIQYYPGTDSYAIGNYQGISIEPNAPDAPALAEKLKAAAAMRESICVDVVTPPSGNMGSPDSFIKSLCR
jgi:hypothetical protein